MNLKKDTGKSNTNNYFVIAGRYSRRIHCIQQIYVFCLKRVCAVCLYFIEEDDDFMGVECVHLYTHTGRGPSI